jgi:hypothetical protein
MLPTYSGSSRHGKKGKKAKGALKLGVCALLSIFVCLLVWEVSVITHGGGGGGSGASNGGGAQVSSVDASASGQPSVSPGVVSSLRAQLQLAESAKAELERQVADEHKRGIRAGEAPPSALQADVDRLRTEVAAARAAASTSTGEVTHLQGEISRLVSEQSLANEKLSASEHERQSLSAQLQKEKTKHSSSSSFFGRASSSSAAASDATSDKWYNKKPGRLLSPYEFHRPLPPLIDAWRNGKIDWHDLIPSHSSLWERYGESKDDKFNFMKLVMKEVAVTDYLTQYQDSGLASNFGHDFGPMRNYSMCNLVDDPCLIHGREECDRNSFCHWEDDAASCSTATEEQSHQSCPTGQSAKKLVSSRLTPADARDCKRYIHEKVGEEAGRRCSF